MFYLLFINVLLGSNCFLPHSNTPILKVCSSGSRVLCPLTTDIVRQFSSFMGTTWRNYGSSMRNNSRFEHHIRLQVQTFAGRFYKSHVIIVTTTGPLGFLVTMLQLRDWDFLFTPALVHCDNITLQNWPQFLNSTSPCCKWVLVDFIHVSRVIRLLTRLTKPALRLGHG